MVAVLIAEASKLLIQIQKLGQLDIDINLYLVNPTLEGQRIYL